MNEPSKATKRWYVLHTVRQSVADASSVLSEQGIATYVPQQYRHFRKDGDDIVRLAELIPHTLFASLTQHEFDTIFRRNMDDTTQQPQSLPSVTYHYDMSYRNIEGKREPLTIPDSQMHNFIIATQTHDEQIALLPIDWQPKDGGQAVRVVRGRYKGLYGTLTSNRSGQRYIVVTLKGLLSIKMPHIRDAHLSPLKSLNTKH